jgi:hypothetical protein
VSKELLEVALLPTVRAEALPLLAPPILLGVVLPGLGSLGGWEDGHQLVAWRRRWHNAERDKKWTLPVKMIFWQEEQENPLYNNFLDSRLTYFTHPSI